MPALPPPSRDRRRRIGASLLTLAAVTMAALSPRPASGQEEVPFITTPDNVTLAMLEVAGVKAADHVIDLGSGDGRIVITAAKRFGASGLGVEIVPDLVAKSRANARAAGVADKTEFREQNLFDTDLSRATVVTMYLLPELNLQLRARLLALPPGTRIVSHDWEMGDWAPDQTVTLAVPDKVVGREKLSRVHLWRVPVRVQGLWCGDDGSELAVEQRFQRFSASLKLRNLAIPAAVFDGRIDVDRLTAQTPHVASFVAAGGELRVQTAPAAAPGLRERQFKPARDGRCG